MKTKTILTALAFLVAGFSEALSQNNVKSLQECIDLALTNNLTMKSGRVYIQRAKDLQGTAFNIDKTNVTLSQSPTSGGGPDNVLNVNQAFDFPTVYTTRKSFLKAETELERSNLALTRNEVIKSVSEVYYQLLFSKETIYILQRQDSIYNKFLYLANAKLRSGETSQLEQINAERLYNENKVALQNAGKSYNNIQLILQQLLNTDEAINPMEMELPILNAESLTQEYNPKQTPQGIVLANSQEVSKKSLTMIKQGYLPGFNFAIKSQLLLKGFNPYNLDRSRFAKGNFMGFEVGVSVPLFFGEQRSKTKAARRDLEISQLKQEEGLLKLEKEYQNKINEFTKAKNTLNYYAKNGNKQAAEIIRISKISYEKGEIGYVEYIQNLKTAVEISLQYANAVNDYNQSIITLNYLQGNK